MIKNQINLGGRILLFIIIVGLILILCSQSSAQSWRILNPKINLLGNNIELRMNGMFGPPEDYDNIINVNIFDVRSDKVLLDQMFNLYSTDFYNNIDKDQELYCLAQNSYWESRGESFADKIAVANVVLNRTRDPRFPKTNCNVIREKCQFSWYCAGLNRVNIRVTDSNRYDHRVVPWIESILAAIIAKNKLMKDPTNGATHFYAHKLVRPIWAKNEFITTKTSGHTFVKLP